MKHINLQLLEEKISRETNHIDKSLLDSIKNYVQTSEKAKLAIINPNRLAHKFREDKLKTLKAFLFLTKSGVFDLEWAVHCPHCNGTEQISESLAGIKHEGRCGACVTSFEADFDKHTEIRFRINPAICDTKDADPFELILNSHETEPGISLQLDPKGEHFLEMSVTPGVYALVNVPEKKLYVFRIPDVGSESKNSIEIIYNSSTPPISNMLLKNSGSLALTLKNETEFKQDFVLAKLKEPDWTSAALVSTLQEFRDLFSKEMLSTKEAFSIKNLSFLFTDIKGSTELYEKLGDSKAFYLVKEHFKIMEEVVKKYNGGIVKTIGDAVMAVFSNPNSALACSLELIKAFDQFNEEGGTRDKIIIKVGIHSGPCIAVTLNERIDYFGSSVNIAARVQGLSDGRDIMLSDRFFSESRADSKLLSEDWSSESFTTSLKGLAEKFKIHKIVRVE